MRYIYILLLFVLASCSTYLGSTKNTAQSAESYGWEFQSYDAGSNCYIYYDADLDWEIYLYDHQGYIYKAIYIMNMDSAIDFRIFLLESCSDYGDILRSNKYIYYFQYVDDSTVLVTILKN